MPATLAMGHFLPPLFRAAFGRDAAKRVAQLADRSHETGRNWLRGYAQPSAELLIRMARDNEKLRLALIEAMTPDGNCLENAGPAAAGTGSDEPGKMVGASGDMGAQEVAP